MIHLIKRDLFLIKKYLLLMGLVAFAVPIFFAWQTIDFPAFYTFLLVNVFEIFIMFQFVSMSEARFPKAAALVCSAPYPRASMVKAKYVLFGMIFVYCYVVYCIVAVALPNINYLTPLNVIMTLFILSVIYGVYVPIKYKYGYEKTKMIFMIIIVGIPYLLPSLFENFSSDSLSSIPEPLLYILPVVGVVVILFVSLKVSIKLFEKQEI